MRLLRYFLVLFSFFLTLSSLAGCGSGNSDIGFNVPSDSDLVEPVGISTLVVRQTIQAQTVPKSVDRVRITCYKYAIAHGVLDPLGGGVTLPSLEFPLSPTYTVENVPSDSSAVKLEYLQDGELVGIYIEEVTLTPGQTYEIVDPSFVSRPQGVEQFQLYLQDGLTFLAPPGEKPVVVAGLSSHPWIYFASPTLNSAEAILFGETPSSAGGRSHHEDVEFSDAIQAFTVFESSDPSVLVVRNNGTAFSNFRSGALWPIKTGEATISANFFGVQASLDVQVVSVKRPFVRLSHIPMPIGDPQTIEHIGPADLIYENQVIKDVDVSSELIYRPSDKPDVAQWDSRPGREGYIVRGSEAGRVVLWAQHPNNYVWAPITVENR